MELVCYGLMLACATETHALAAGFVDLRSVGPASDVRDLAGDRRGFVWMAGASGVCRFDGTTTSCVAEEPALALHIDAEDSLWAGMADGLVIQVLTHPLGVRRFGRVAGTITSVSRTATHLWVSSSKGLYAKRIDQPEGTFERVLPESTTDTLVANRDAIFAAVGHDLFEIQGRDYHSALVVRFAQQVSVISRGLRSGKLMVGTTTGTLYEVERDYNVTLMPVPTGNASTITSIAQDKNGMIWGGGDSSLFWLANGKTETVGDSASGLPHPQVNAIDFDLQGNVWLATPGGLARLRTGYPIRSFGRADGLPSEMTFGVTGDTAGWIWATTGVGISGWNGTWSRHLGADSGLDGFDVRSLAVDPHNHIWIGSLGSGLFMFDGTTARKKWPAGQKAAGQGVRALRPRKAGGVWVGFDGGGLGRFVDNELTLEFAPSPGHQDRVFDMIELTEPSGLWLALSHDGVARWQNGRLQRYGSEQGIAAEALCLFGGANRDLWIGTNGAGLSRLRDDRLARVTSTQGLADDHIFGLVDDKLGRLWMSGPKGLSVASLSQLSAAADAKLPSVETQIFGTAEGIPGEPVRSFPPSAFRASDGTLWFPTLRGMVNVDPTAMSPAPLPSAIVFDDVQVNGQSVVGLAASPTAMRSSNLVFRFALPFFAPNHKIRLRYRLDGLKDAQDTWQDSPQSREARYERVPPGRYRFVVQAYLAEASPMQNMVEADFDVNLPQPLQDNLALRLLGVAGFLFMAVAAYRFRLNRIKQAHEMVLAERTRIAHDIHDSLEQDLSGLRFQIGAAALSMQRKPDLARKHLDRAAELLEDGVVDLRNSIWGLRSSDVDTSELAAALRERLDRVTSGTTVDIVVDTRGQPRTLPAQLGMQMLNVAREAVTNALKHAQATTIHVTFDTANPAEVLLTIRDNGRGLPDKNAVGPRADGHGVGLSSMETRAKAIGGVFVVQSNEQRGTCVTLRVPRPPKARTLRQT